MSTPASEPSPDLPPATNEVTANTPGIFQDPQDVYDLRQVTTISFTLAILALISSFFFWMYTGIVNLHWGGSTAHYDFFHDIPSWIAIAGVIFPAIGATVAIKRGNDLQDHTRENRNQATIILVIVNCCILAMIINHAIGG